MAYNQILPDDTGREHIIEIKDLYAARTFRLR